LNSCSQPHDGCFEHRQINHGDRVRTGTIECAGVEHQRRADALLFGDVRVSVTDDVVPADSDGAAKELVIVAVEEGDSAAGEFQLAETFVTGEFRPPDGGAKPGLVVVYIAEDEMRRPAGEEWWDFVRAEVAAVNHLRDTKAFEQAHRALRVFDVAVRVADDAEKHGNKGGQGDRVQGGKAQ
jgi:hypothetical protein